MSRKPFEETFKSIMNGALSNDYMYYAHMITHCKVIFDDRLPAMAGVTFNKNKYELYINPEMFNKEPEQIRAGVLKHEMLHILYNHVGRKGDRNHEIFNYATDCAINQHINRAHLPEMCIYPETLEKELNVHFPQNKDAELYYDLIKQNAPKSGSSKGKCSGGEPQEYDIDAKNFDSHEKWEKSQGEEHVRKYVTRKMLEESKRNTQKSKGNLPSSLDELIDIFKEKAQVSWRNEIKKIAGNRRVDKRPTIRKRPRRFQKRDDLRGKTKDSMCDIVCVVDVSGSMGTEEILLGLNEIHTICKLTNTSMKLIQVDTEVHEVTDFDKNTKIFNRSAGGGTVMQPGMQYIKDKKIPADLVILITDGFIEDISRWGNEAPKQLIALVTGDAKIRGIDSYGKRYKQFDLHKEK